MNRILIFCYSALFILGAAVMVWAANLDIGNGSLKIKADYLDADEIISLWASGSCSGYLKSDKTCDAGGGHDAVTLGADADVLLGLSTQQLTFDTQTANYVFAGPTTGGATDPTFRALVAGDIPDISATYQAADADLTTYAGITPSANTQTLLANSTFADWRADLDVSQRGNVHITKSAAYTVGTDSAEECYGGVIYVDTAATITACDNLNNRMSYTLIVKGDIAVSADVQSDDRQILDGTALDDGDKASNSSCTTKAGGFIHFEYESASGWSSFSGCLGGDNWEDGGA